MCGVCFAVGTLDQWPFSLCNDGLYWNTKMGWDLTWAIHHLSGGCQNVWKTHWNQRAWARLRLQHYPQQLHVPGCTSFPNLFAITLKVIWEVMIKYCQKAYRRRGKTSLIMFWHFLTSAILLNKREKRNKVCSVKIFCFLFPLDRKNQVAVKLNGACSTKACLPRKFSCSQLAAKGSFPEVCPPGKQVLSL